MVRSFVAAIARFSQSLVEAIAHSGGIEGVEQEGLIGDVRLLQALSPAGDIAEESCSGARRTC